LKRELGDPHLGRVSLDRGSVAAKGGASAAVLPFIARLIAMLDSECISFARQVVEKAATAVGPVEKAEILPAEAYTSDQFWEFEKFAIFSREWLCVGHVNEVPNPGDHLPLTVLEEPVLLVRDDAGAIRVLSAICQHRGHPIFGGLAQRAGDARCLNAKTLVCPYHNWTYKLDGRLIGAPSMQDTTPVADLRQRVRLVEIRSEIFHGLVFINFDADAEPLGPRLAKLGRELATYPLEDLVPTQMLVLKDLKWNWKLHHENALEPYHTDYVHKGFHTAVPSQLTRFYEFDSGDGQVLRTTGFLAEEGDLFEEKGSRRLPEIEGLTPEQRKRVLFVSIMPNVVAVVQPSSVTMTILNPNSAGAIGSRRINLYPAAALSDPDFERITSEQFERNKILIMQDQLTLIALQEAYRSRFTPRGKLARLETAIPQLNQWIVDKYRRALDRLDS
jgi:phenylpropionate dioxygenase-like ring-hydroxylating dioxygenase large terminal subunit